jgi:RND family efflux transporter MFP subunit
MKQEPTGFTDPTLAKPENYGTASPPSPIPTRRGVSGVRRSLKHGHGLGLGLGLLMLDSTADTGKQKEHTPVSLRYEGCRRLEMNETSKPNISGLKIDQGERQRDGGGRRVMFVSALILVTIAVAVVYFISPTGGALVEVATARSAPTGGARTVLNASGYVEPRRRSTVAAKITGRVIEMLVDEGMWVEKDQVLARLDDSDARTRYQAYLADRDVARAALDELEVNLADTQRTLRRTLQLHEDGIASEQDVDSATAAVDALRARLSYNRASLEAANADVAVARQDLENYVIRAPFAGVAVSKDAQPGEMVSPVSAGGGYTRTGISTIVDMESLEIEVDVNESYIARVQPGQPADAVLDAYPDWHIPATVRTIIPTADRQKATVKVRLTFDELDPRILPDMGIKVAFQEAVVENVEPSVVQSLVPAAAVRSDGSQRLIFVVEGDVLERRAVAVGGEAGTEIEVISGVMPGERVVVNGPDNLEDGQRVKVVS